MKLSRHYGLQLLRLAAAVLIAFALSYVFSLPYFERIERAQAMLDPASIDLSGYAWNDNTGWISFNCSNNASCATSNYKVSMNYYGSLSGYAWSDNIGWISFNSADVAGCPSGTCPPRLNRVFGAGQGDLSGWAKALSGGSLQAGGWDGFIELAGVTAGSYPSGTNGSGTGLAGFAYGSDVVGWISFSCQTDNTCARANYGVVASSLLICRSDWQSPCATPPNVCGLRNFGSFQCDGTCSVTAPPPDSDCPSQGGAGGKLNVGGGGVPTGGGCEKLSASPKFVGYGGSSTLTWDGTCQANACTLYQSETGQLLSTSTQGSTVISGLTARRTYVFSCTNHVDVTVGPSFDFKEF